jgi:hypothetical protein
VTVRPFPGRAPLPRAQWYSGRPVDPASGYDVATLALLRWWSVSVSDPHEVDPISLPEFHRQFVGWWESAAEHRWAALVEEQGGPASVPVAMGWVVPDDTIPTPSRDGRRTARPRAIYLVPGVATDHVLGELHRALFEVADTHGLLLPPSGP